MGTGDEVFEVVLLSRRFFAAPGVAGVGGRPRLPDALVSVDSVQWDRATLMRFSATVGSAWKPNSEAE